MSPDIINGAFELIGGFMLWFNVRALYRAKHFAGVTIGPTTFFMAWGVFNVAMFYPHYGAWISWLGALNLTAANAVWLGQMVYYSRRQRARANARIREFLQGIGEKP